MITPARAVPATAPTISIRNYAIVTAAYWAFTLTDGALRMLVLLHFNQLGYTPVQLAFLFLLYEFFGIVTNLVGGWVASRTGLRFTLVLGLVLQVIALGLLALLNRGWSIAASVAYVMGCQALSGIAKDLTKMSAKSAVKVLVPKDDESGLFKWVAVLTGSKNALKGAGFFVGGFLLSMLGFRGALAAMATGVFVVLVFVLGFLPAAIGQAKTKAAFSGILSKLVLAYSEADRVSLSVGFYYMANACGRLLGTLLSGLLYQLAGVSASLWGAVVLAAAAGLGALLLPPVTTEVGWAGAKGDD
jgi:MFS transporter